MRHLSSVGRTLRVIIVGARNLPNGDYDRFRVGGLSDPYCTCEIPGKPRSRISTCVVDDTLNPTWNHECRISDFAGGDSLVFRVWDKDETKSDDLLAEPVELSAAQLLGPTGFEGSIPLVPLKPMTQQQKKKPILQVKVTEEEVLQLAELMATLGPRYKAMGRETAHKLASSWSEDTLVQRRLRRGEQLRAQARLSGNIGSPKETRGAESEDVGRLPWSLARSRHSHLHVAPHIVLEDPSMSREPRQLDMCTTWHSMPVFGDMTTPSCSPSMGQSVNRFAAALPPSHHPAVHPGARA